MFMSEKLIFLTPILLWLNYLWMIDPIWICWEESGGIMLEIFVGRCSQHCNNTVHIYSYCYGRNFALKAFWLNNTTTYALEWQPSSFFVNHIQPSMLSYNTLQASLSIVYNQVCARMIASKSPKLWYAATII